METKISVGELYEKIDKTVGSFVGELTALLPKTPTTAISNMILMHHSVALKEMAKLCINLHVSSLKLEDDKKEKDNNSEAADEKLLSSEK